MNQRSQLCPFGYTIAFVTETVVPLFHDGVYAFLIASFEGSDAYDLDPSRNLGPAFMVGVEQHPLFRILPRDRSTPHTCQVSTR